MLASLRAFDAEDQKKNPNMFQQFLSSHMIVSYTEKFRNGFRAVYAQMLEQEIMHQLFLLNSITESDEVSHQIERVLTLCQRLLALDQQNQTALQAQGYVLFLKNEYDAAAASYDVVLQKHIQEGHSLPQTMSALSAVLRGISPHTSADDVMTILKGILDSETSFHHIWQASIQYEADSVQNKAQLLQRAYAYGQAGAWHCAVADYLEYYNLKDIANKVRARNTNVPQVVTEMLNSIAAKNQMKEEDLHNFFKTTFFEDIKDALLAQLALLANKQESLMDKQLFMAYTDIILAQHDSDETILNAFQKNSTDILNKDILGIIEITNDDMRSRLLQLCGHGPRAECLVIKNWGEDCLAELTQHRRQDHILKMLEIITKSPATYESSKQLKARMLKSIQDALFIPYMKGVLVNPDYTFIKAAADLILAVQPDNVLVMACKASALVALDNQPELRELADAYIRAIPATFISHETRSAASQHLKSVFLSVHAILNPKIKSASILNENTVEQLQSTAGAMSLLLSLYSVINPHDPWPNFQRAEMYEQLYNAYITYVQILKNINIPSDNQLVQFLQINIRENKQTLFHSLRIGQEKYSGAKDSLNQQEKTSIVGLLAWIINNIKQPTGSEPLSDAEFAVLQKAKNIVKQIDPSGSVSLPAQPGAVERVSVKSPENINRAA